MGYTLTNKYNLPETIVNALKYDTHTLGGHISITSLVDSPRIRVLKKQHNLTEDVSEKLAALLGTSMHSILERANIKNLHRRHFVEVINHLTSTVNASQDDADKKKTNAAIGWLSKYMDLHLPEEESDYVIEQTLRAEVNDWTISGTFDLYHKPVKKLQDYKLTSVYTYLDEESRKKHDAQINCYAWMMRRNGFEIEQASIVFFFKDWSANGILKNRDYPKCPIVEMPVKLYPDDRMTKYITERVILHQQAEEGMLKDCTGKEKWASSDVFKVKQNGLKRSIKNFETEAAAKDWAEKNKHSYAKPLMIDTVPGESKRCENYCPVRDVCDQRKREKELRNQ